MMLSFEKKRKKIKSTDHFSMLPDDLKLKAETILYEDGFRNYKGIAELINNCCQERGLAVRISKYNIWKLARRMRGLSTYPEQF